MFIYIYKQIVVTLELIVAGSKRFRKLRNPILKTNLQRLKLRLIL